LKLHLDIALPVPAILKVYALVRSSDAKAFAFGRVCALALALLGATAASANVLAAEPSSRASMIVSAIVLPSCQLDVAMTVRSGGSRTCLTTAGYENVQDQPGVVLTRNPSGTVTEMTIAF
jgi:hypothetical protein